MPNINAIQVPEYQPLEPYHHTFDNRPLKVIIQRQELINNETDINSQILRESIGNQGTLANRLNQSINENGSLNVNSINSPQNSSGDVIMHNIAYHTDGTINLSSSELSDILSLGYSVSNPVSFVRMLEAERDKLALISDEATDVFLEVETPSYTVLFESGGVEFVPSDTISWNVSGGNKISAVTNFSTNSLHTHVYDETPVHQNLDTPDYTNYQSTSISTPFIEGSLRVFINGIRITEESPGIYVPGPDGPEDNWTRTYFTPDSANGTFFLNRSIDEDDIIKIDFNISNS